MSARLLMIGLVGFGFFAWLIDLTSTKSRNQQTTGRPVVQKDEEILIEKTYSVADLVVPVPVDFTSPTKEDGKILQDKLISTIQGTVTPASWMGAGGRGNLEYFPLGMALVVRQTAKVHAEIQELLAELRRLQDTQVVLDLRLVKIPEESFERVGVDFNRSPDDKGGLQTIEIKDPEKKVDLPETLGVCFLDQKKCEQFMQSFQEDRRTNILSAPRIIMFNGQTARMEVGDSHSFLVGMKAVEKADKIVLEPQTQTFQQGVQISLCPVVAEDQSAIRLWLELKMNSLDTAQVPLVPVQTHLENGKVAENHVQLPKHSTLAVTRTLRIPLGRSALLACGKVLEEVRTESAPPLLNRIPYVNRLFRNVSYGREASGVYLLVTPTLITQPVAEVAQRN